jgi:DNA-binding NarL/FixJ family response regulator
VGQPATSPDRSTTVRVVVADDTLLIREGVQRMLESYDDIEVVGLAGELKELLMAVQEHDPDVVVTDIRMPPTCTDEGIRAATELRKSSPETGVVVLSQYAEPSYALELFSNGTSGRAYLLKERVGETDEVANAVREVAAGGSVTDASIVELLVSSARNTTDPLADLTPREHEVLAGIAEGKNNAGIAGALGLSERAVEKHINSLFAKLGLFPEPEVHRRVMAVLLFLDSQRDHR